jgi:mRNA interferase MazF
VVDKTFKRGDLIWIEFDPQAGREMKGRHPALVVSPKEYNKRSPLIICCAITSTVRNSPWEVKIPTGLSINGVILTDQIRSFDWKARKAKFECELSDDALFEVLSKLQALILET